MVPDVEKDEVGSTCVRAIRLIASRPVLSLRNHIHVDEILGAVYAVRRACSCLSSTMMAERGIGFRAGTDHTRIRSGYSAHDPQ